MRRTSLRLPAISVWAAALLLFCSTSAMADGPLTARRHSGSDLMFGAYTYGGVWGGMDPVLDLEAAIGRRLDIVHWFTSFDNDWDAAMVEPLGRSGRLPLISWQPMNVSTADIAAGTIDDYLAGWADGVAAYGMPVYLRPFPEMNGDWTAWNGNSGDLVAAWRHMVDLFAEHGADNVRWVWSPNVTDEPRADWNRMENYYPGAEYVDVLALDGYNWGSVRDGTAWQSFAEILATGYGRLTALGSQPIWMAETASAETGGDKGLWIEEMFGAAGEFPQLDAIVWFNENKETDWRVASSAAALASFQQQLPGLGDELAGTTTVR